MNKQLRQYLGLISSVAAYYTIHEGAHLLCALLMGVYKQVNFMGLGIQIDVFTERMAPVQMGIFCLAGSFSTIAAAWILIVSANRITTSPSPTFKACLYYITLVMLFCDPLYLSLLCGFFGGGDMNGISLLAPAVTVRIAFAGIFIVHAIVFFKVVLPKYKLSFEN